MDYGKVIERLSPSREEQKRAEQAIECFLSRMGRIKDAKVLVGGSFAKGTWITGMYDIDVFVCFDYKRYSEKSGVLSELLEKVLKIKKIGCKRIHGSRDYFEVKAGGYSFDVIPILEILNAKQAKNTTDCSPLHTKWVKKNIDKKLADQVRLLKAFCAAQKCYGAESYIKGFSGYACEILTAHYGSFITVARAASKWSEDKKTVIDCDGHYKSKNALAVMNVSKTQSPLVIIDPVQKDRNAAAASSTETFGRFRHAAAKLLLNPSEKFFTISITTPEQLKRKSKSRNVIVLEAVPMEGKDDVVYTKILKAGEHIKQKLEFNGFKIYDSGIEWNKNPLLWIVTDKRIDRHTITEGPPLNAKSHVERFRKAHKGGVFVKGKKAYARIKRAHTEPSTLLKAIIRSDSYIKERAKRVILHD